MDVIAPLSADFHLVIPSLPGYGFSGKPTVAKWSVEHIAAAWDALMRAIGYDRYFAQRSEEHTSELQSLMRISYAVFCLKKQQQILYYSTRLYTQQYRKN